MFTMTLHYDNWHNEARSTALFTDIADAFAEVQKVLGYRDIGLMTFTRLSLRRTGERV